MYQLKYDLIGKNSGDFRPKYKQPEQAYFLECVENQLNKRNIYKVFSPHCQMTTNVARIGDKEEKIITPWLIRTPPGFDGAMVTEPRTAIAIFNADCPVIILFDRQRGHLVLLHAGFRCLLPKDPKAPNIVSTAFRDFKLDPSALEAFIGFGAGRCCYGIDHHIKELDNQKIWPFLWKVEKGPRTGQKSLDLFNLARYRLRNQGLMESDISVNYTCTACTGRNNDKNGQYYSNIYEGRDTGRNLVLAWFDTR